MTPPPADATTRVRRIPARAWLRPALMLLGGLAVAALLLLMRQHVAAVVFAAFALLMGYWTSPLRRGPHTPFLQAMSERSDDTASVLWAPGDPLSSRMQAALRNRHESIVWVNVHQDQDAAQLLASHCGRLALPLVIVGEDVLIRATVGQLLDLQAAARQN